MKIAEPNYVFEVISIEHIFPDVKQPRINARKDEDRIQLIASIKMYGIETPLAVIRTTANEYTIIDGHRRYYSAKQIGLKKVPCRVYEKMSEGELESRRYEIQNNRKNWKPLERAGVFKAIRDFFQFKSNRELSDHLNISETLAANSLQLMGEQIKYLEMMASYKLPESYQTEFMRLKPKLRRIKEFEIEEIIGKIFEKVEHDVITTSRDFRRLGSLFKRGTANEEALHWFLSNHDETVEELLRRSSRSGVSLYAEDLMKAIAEKKQLGASFDPQEEITLKQLSALLAQVL